MHGDTSFINRLIADTSLYGVTTHATETVDAQINFNKAESSLTKMLSMYSYIQFLCCANIKVKRKAKCT